MAMPVPGPSVPGASVGDDDRFAREAATVLGAAGNPTALRVLVALEGGRRNVKDLAAGLGLSPSAPTHPLARLRMFRLVRTTREGNRTYYGLTESGRRLVETARFLVGRWEAADDEG